jgi:hypothetical protein
MAGTGAALALQRQSQRAARDQQARRSLSAHVVDSRRPLSFTQGRAPQRPVRSIWANRLKLARGFNVAAVALANKNARVIWALLTRGENYRPTAIAEPGKQAA